MLIQIFRFFLSVSHLEMYVNFWEYLRMAVWLNPGVGGWDVIWNRWHSFVTAFAFPQFLLLLFWLYQYSMRILTFFTLLILAMQISSEHFVKLFLSERLRGMGMPKFLALFMVKFFFLEQFIRFSRCAICSKTSLWIYVWYISFLFNIKSWPCHLAQFKHSWRLPRGLDWKLKLCWAFLS